MSLVTDLFPNQVLEKTAYPELEEAIESQVEAEGLIYHSPWVLKLIQVSWWKLKNIIYLAQFVIKF